MQAVLATLLASSKTTETKAIFVSALWAGAARFIPGVPIALPPVDLSGMGLGTLTLSPAVLVLIALVQITKKVLTDGATPFLPTPIAKKEEAGA